ncbi:MAG: ParB/RepB/Spo0J family partition protein [Desulfatibacillum sp.]|nr:ParB/RepB/Spo0J family partition protein [Desulfatibacillum sp.]
MGKSYLQSAEASSAFLNPVPLQGDEYRKGERQDTVPFREARFINIERVKPDPDQPRKNFDQDSLERLAESIRELGEIIDPLTVEYDEKEDIFRILSGERRFRAAKLVGLETLPCILKEVDDKKRILLQLIANLQRENITPLEETAGIRTLIEKYGYSQTQAAKILNKSRSYVSQTLGLERLTPPAKEIVQTSELSKEALIQASREKDPEKQVKILKKASSEGQTVRQIREDLIGGNSPDENPLKKRDSTQKSFKKWTWTPEHKGFVITIQFKGKQNTSEKAHLIRAALEEASNHLNDGI